MNCWGEGDTDIQSIASSKKLSYFGLISSPKYRIMNSSFTQTECISILFLEVWMVGHIHSLIKVLIVIALWKAFIKG